MPSKGRSSAGVANGCCRIRSATGTPAPQTAPFTPRLDALDGGLRSAGKTTLLRSRMTVDEVPFISFPYHPMGTSLKGERLATQDATSPATVTVVSKFNSVFKVADSSGHYLPSTDTLVGLSHRFSKAVGCIHQQRTVRYRSRILEHRPWHFS